MEKEEQKWGHEIELEEEENIEDAPSLKVRRSRTPIAEDKDNTSAPPANRDTSTTQLNSDETNGHIIQPSISAAENGVDVDESLLCTEVRKETQIIDAHPRSSSCVYYDKDEGIWNCQICCWTFGTACPSVDLIQNPKGHLHELMIYKTLNQREPCFTYELEGSKLSSFFSGDKHIGRKLGDGKYDNSTGNFDSQNSFDSVIDCQVEGSKKDKILSGLQHSTTLSEECGATNWSSALNEIENEDIDLISQTGLEVTDIDVEKVLEKQNTHDLYCPNCNSCITRRVILRKRKRRVRIPGEDVKRNKLETAVDSTSTHSSGQAADIQVQNMAETQVDGTFEPAVNDYEREREPDIFRCLSCFSFFIPTGNGFKLFRLFRDKGEKTAVEDQQKAVMSKSWISSIFASEKERTLEPGSGTRSDALKTTNGTCLLASHVNDQKDLSRAEGFEGLLRSGIAESQEDGNKISPSSTKELYINGKEVINAGDNSNNTKKKGDVAKDHFEAVIGSQPNTSNMSIDVVACHQSDPFKVATDKISVINGKSPVTGSQINTPNISIDVVAYHQSDPSKAPTEKISVTNEESPNDAVSGNRPDGLQLPISSHGSSPTPEKSHSDQNPNLTIQNTGADKNSIVSLPTEVLALTEPHMNKKMNISVDISCKDKLHVGAMILNNTVDEKDATFGMNNYEGAHLDENSQQIINENTQEFCSGELFKISKEPLVLSLKEISLNQEQPPTVTKDLRKVATEVPAAEDTVIVVDSEIIARAASQRERDLSVSEEAGASSSLATHISVAEPKGADARQAYKIEIIKSIVYGGLVESITSLGVVSSAAGGNAATLNILALALANLVGGLILIGHNLWDLKKEQVTEQMDRYKELLGHRENFLLHMTVVLLSFLVFGVIAPITYGFSFRKSDNRELKLLAAAAASLVCILVLAIGKEYVKRPPKSYLKTIAYYVILGFMVSGVSYAVGELIKRLLEKIHFQLDSSVFLTMPEMISTAAELASY